MKELYYTPIYSDIRKQIVDSCIQVMESGKKFIYILPSREAMFDVRSRIVEKYGGLVNQYVLGFDDLEREIVKDNPCISNTIGEPASILIIKNILKDMTKDGGLVFFNKVWNKPGFIEDVYMVIKRLKRLYLSPDSFRKIMPNKTLYYKCTDILNIYQRYEDYKKEKNIYDIDDISIKAAEEAGTASIFKDVDLFVVDGFINIDPVNIILLNQIIKHHPSISFIASIPFKNDIINEFVSEEVLKDFTSLGFSEAPACTGTYKAVPKDLLAVGENLFSQASVLIERADNIRIMNAPCIEHEVRQAARHIKQKLLKDKAKPEDIAIYINDTELYQDYICKVFREYGIPVRLQPKQLLLSQPVVRDILGIINKDIQPEDNALVESLIASRYLISSDILSAISTDILSVISSGMPSDIFSSLNEESGQDNGLEQVKIKRQDEVVLKDGTGATGSDASNMPDTVNKLDAVNKLNELIQKIVKFRENTTGEPSAKKHCEAMQWLIQELDIRNNIINLYKNGVIDSEIFIRDLKTLDKLTDALRQMEQIYSISGLGDEKLDFEYFLNTFLQAYAGETIDKVNPNVAGVKVISPDLARGQYYDYVFILGINEGVFPAASGVKNIFSSFEDDLLYEAGINLYNYRWELQREKIRFNLACASAGKELYLSFRTSDEQGGLIIKSSFLESLEQLFSREILGKIQSNRIYMRDRFKYEKDGIMSMNEVTEAILTSLWQFQRGNSGSLNSLKRFLPLISSEQVIHELKYINDAGKMEYTRQFSLAFSKYDGMVGNIPSKQGLASYSFSASQINSYASCRLKYFFERVLDLGSFEDDQGLSPKSEGILYHDALKMYYQNNTNVEIFDEARLRSIIFSLMEEVDNTGISAYEYEAWKNEVFETLKEFLIKDIEYIKDYYNKAGMHIKPVYLEQFFEESGVFKGARFRGFIDRVDLEITEQGNYTGRYIMYDYKIRSVKDFRSCVEGGDFQLAVYYYGILNKLKGDYRIENPQCMAMFYYSIEGAKRDGFVRSDCKKYLFSGNRGPRTTISPLNFEILMNWLKNRIENMLESIRRGDFSLPYQCPGEYFRCEFESICRFDKYRVAAKKRESDG